MKAKKIVIDTIDNDYYFYNCVIEFSSSTFLVRGEGVKFTISVEKITGLKIEGED